MLSTVLFRESVSTPGVVEGFARALAEGLSAAGRRPILWLCIGTDTAVGDCLGPLVGTLLREKMPELKVIGTLAEPLHAGNLVAQLADIKSSWQFPFLAAVDASLGRPEQVGCITLRQGALWPGAGLRRRLPPVGQLAITGVVGSRSLRGEDHILHRTRLSLVWEMASVIVEGIRLAGTGTDDDASRRLP